MRGGRTLAGLAALLAVLACAAPPPATANGTAPAAPPPAPPYLRAITLAPHITELVFAAGAGSHIAGTVERSDYPPAAQAIARVGDGVAVSAEATLALRPDLVIAWHASGAARRLSPTLRLAQVPLIYSAPASLDDIPTEIQRMGALFGTSAAAEPAARALAARIQALRARHAGRSPVTVFIEISSPPLYVVASDPAIDDALKACGGVNIFADIATPAAQASAESVLVRQPDVIIAPYTSADEIAHLRKRWARAGLAAASAGRVYGLDPDALFRPGPRLVDAAETLCGYLDQFRRSGH
jgi:iron complex transport system substrate-binding protein/vitamin B12 transport system substrate-binding protein